MKLTVAIAAFAVLALPATTMAFSGSTNTAGSGTTVFAPTSAAGVPGNSLANVAGRLATERGRALYTFASDPIGRSVCSGNCAAQWPPYLVGPVPANIPGFNAVIRSNGTRQWAFNGKPLYLYVGDAAAGQFNGDAVPGWRSIALQTN